MQIPNCDGSATVQIGCVDDGAGGSLGPVFYDPGTNEVWHFELATGNEIRPYAGPVGVCPSGSGGGSSVPDIEIVCASTDDRLLAFNTGTGALTELNGAAIADGATGVACAGDASDRELLSECRTDGTDTFQRVQMFDVAGAVPVLLGTVWVDESGAVVPAPAGPLASCVATVDPLIRWACVCDDGAPTVNVWRKFSSADNGNTWVPLGLFTEQFGTTPYVPVGTIVECSTLGTPTTGHRARRAVLPVGPAVVIPAGLPSPGVLIESLSWSSRNATGTITDSAGTVSSFVAGEGDTWAMNWDLPATASITVTTGEVVVTWVEVF